MAKETVVKIVCDHCGTDRGDIQSVRLRVGAKEREIDLCAKGRKEFDAAVLPWMDKGSTVNGKATKKAAAAKPRASVDNTRIREWAKANGHEVSDRGRISEDVRAAYEAAN